MMFIRLTIVLFLVTVFSSSCKRLADDCDESKICFTDKPELLYLEILLSPADDQDWILVKIYEGNVDDGELFMEFETNWSEEYVLVPVDTRFAVEAFYLRGQDTIRTIDGDYVAPEHFFNCEQKCYEWDEDVVFDLKLKE